MKKNFLLVTGGTGGHVIPANNFANYLSSKNIMCTIITDKRGYKYLNNNNIKVHLVSSSNLNGNIISKLFGFSKILFGLIQSFIIVLLLKPTHTISFGSYAAFSKHGLWVVLCNVTMDPWHMAHGHINGLWPWIARGHAADGRADGRTVSLCARGHKFFVLCALCFVIF